MTADRTDNPSPSAANALENAAGNFAIAADHPAIPGHFPGHPIVPGAVILDRMIALTLQSVGGDIGEVAQAKFLRPLMPGEVCRVVVDARARPTLRVSCMTEAGPIANAVLRLKAAP